MKLREKVVVEGLPYSWSTNLDDDGIREFYELYANHICEAPTPTEAPATGKVVIHIPLRFAFLAFRDGICMWSAAGEMHTVLYRTNQEWELWNARQEEIEELRQEQEAEKAVERQLLETEDRHLVERAKAGIKTGELKLAAAYITARMDLRLSTRGIRGLSFDWYRISDLLWEFAEFPDSEYGIEFIRKYALRPEVFANFAHWFAVRCGLPADKCAEQTNFVYTEGMKCFPQSAHLWAAACLFWRRIKRYDVAMKICSEAISKGLKDGTKSGFEGRLKRLERESQRARQADSVCSRPPSP